jgi:hypothetical protein
VTVLVKYIENGLEMRVVICSAYLPYDAEDPPTGEVRDLIQYCDEEHLHLIMECDAKAHYMTWGSTNCNGRGEALVEFLGTSSLEILNQGIEPTFCNNCRSEVIDITLGSIGLLENIEGWGISHEPSLSDHMHIRFALRGSLPVHRARNPRSTDCDSFREELLGALDRGPVGCTADETGLGLAHNWVQHALVTAYESCPVRPVKPVSTSQRWTGRPESLRRNVRRLFNESRRDQTTHSRELHREVQRAYKREVRRASKKTWRAFCTSSISYQGRLGCIGPSPETLRPGLAPWWFPRVDILSLRRKH